MLLRFVRPVRSNNNYVRGQDEEVGEDPANQHEEPSEGETPPVHGEEVYSTGEEVALRLTMITSSSLNLLIRKRDQTGREISLQKFQ